jgi:hypothetical protein
VLVIAPNVRGFKPGQSDGFLRTVKIRSTSFRAEVRKSAHIVKFYGMLKNSAGYDGVFVIV